MMRAAGVKNRCDSCILAKQSKLDINVLGMHY